MITTTANRKYTSISNSFFKLAEETTYQFRKQQHPLINCNILRSLVFEVSTSVTAFLSSRKNKFHLQNDASADLFYVRDLANQL